MSAATGIDGTGVDQQFTDAAIATQKKYPSSLVTCIMFLCDMPVLTFCAQGLPFLIVFLCVPFLFEATVFDVHFSVALKTSWAVVNSCQPT